jgi:hypothetical protein
MIRKLFSLLFAGLILFNLSGYYFVFRCDQIRIKSEMKAMIRNGCFRGLYEEISILNPAADHDFKMLDKGEFLYRGKMYDVVSIRVSGAYVVFRCINDIREEQLLAGYHTYSSLVNGLNSPERSRNSQSMLYHIIKHALLKSCSVPTPPASFVVLAFKPVADLNSVELPPASPPPRFA